MGIDLKCGAGSFADAFTVAWSEKLCCRKSTTYVIVSGFAALFSRSPAQEMIYSGFMTDHTPLE
jgi:hypothetical protein